MRYIEHIRDVLQSLFYFFDVKVLFAAICGFWAFLFGADSGAVMSALIALMMFDLATGTTAAFMRKEVSSRRAAKTPLKFGVYLVLVSAAHLADTAVFSGLYLQETMIAFLALTELISILENAGKMGIAVPKQLMKRLEVLRNER